jgi:hypothetical protein
MIYVQEKDFNRQIELLIFLADKGNYSVCAWLYPESNTTSIGPHSIEQSELEAVTSYGANSKPNHTSLIKCSRDSLQIFISAKLEVVSNCDSLALYKENSTLWFAATIGHEGMSLVRNEALLPSLLSAGFSASTEAPSWW